MTVGQSRKTAEQILEVVRAHATDKAMAWLEAALPREANGLARGPFFGAYAGVGRRFGHAVPSLSASHLEALERAGLVVPQVYTLSDLARAALLLLACACSDHEQHVGIALEAFRKGDGTERIALLRALALLPEPGRFVDVAGEAARLHLQDVFDALCCDNPFPARHFSQASWNQLVMKALFTGAPVARMVGWRDRLNPELLRMADDYEAERRAAGREVPADVDMMRAAATATDAGESKDAP